MKNLMHVVREYEEEDKKQVLTVLEGEYLAEKVMLADQQVVWKSRENGFFCDLPEDMLHDLESGIVNINGTRIFCDTLGKEKRIVICGGGHVAIPVIQISRMIGFEVIVLEDRPQYADHARKAGADRVLCEPFAEGLDKIAGNADTYFVIVTRGHRYDQICLEKISRKEHAYIGMIGSRRRVAMVKKNLMEAGCSQKILDEMYSPIGLNIGAESPAEIGVAIMGEIIEVKNKKKRTYGYSKEIMNAILDPQESDGKKVLATIIARRGSAPQGVGTKMLICQSGRCVGTIGGGCMEADVLQKAKAMMFAGEQEVKARICHVDMSGDEAQEEGMVCGGQVDVLLEAADEA